jgi:hypothetical protein
LERSFAVFPDRSITKYLDQACDIIDHISAEDYAAELKRNNLSSPVHFKDRHKIKSPKKNSSIK